MKKFSSVTLCALTRQECFTKNDERVYFLIIKTTQSWIRQ